MKKERKKERKKVRKKEKRKKKERKKIEIIRWIKITDRGNEN